MGAGEEMSADCRFDGLFATVAEQAGGIEPLFDFFFGFLCRKTDFFTVGRVACKEMLDKSFQNWTIKATEKAERERLHREKQQRQQAQQKQPPKDLDSRPKVEELTAEEEALFTHSSNENPNITSKHQDSKSESPHSTSHDAAETSDDEASSSRPEGNGGSTEKYRWTQTLEAVDVYVPVGSGVRAAQCNVKITATRLIVGLKGQNPILDGVFSQKVHAEDCMWTLEDQNTIHLSLEKVDRMRWWSCVLKGDPEIDTKTIVPENSKLSDLDPETRATVEKMMFDQHQKQRGLPTSDQQRQAEMLEKFKQSHPELDFSNAKINWGGSAWGG
ncbi:nuclear movement domain-containing protein [Cyclospora cayetanensis]|uniref:Nuclear migration protein nudC n=1 Tax=Cyclospora cayetanensis TaxID=88456 RepID=A0A1D3D4A8_9EIME|nr:nuclear movement domain-containing protein [Cyclospora cayetanensis]